MENPKAYLEFTSSNSWSAISGFQIYKEIFAPIFNEKEKERAAKEGKGVKLDSSVFGIKDCKKYLKQRYLANNSEAIKIREICEKAAKKRTQESLNAFKDAKKKFMATHYPDTKDGSSADRKKPVPSDNYLQDLPKFLHVIDKQQSTADLLADPREARENLEECWINLKEDDKAPYFLLAEKLQHMEIDLDSSMQQRATTESENHQSISRVQDEIKEWKSRASQKEEELREIKKILNEKEMELQEKLFQQSL